ncbi:MAG: DUF1080 domain-containing protein [Planctomycetales bacterium]|nr:DUF1080 domain-containing protein [Planctomycetales bacterium]
MMFRVCSLSFAVAVLMAAAAAAQQWEPLLLDSSLSNWTQADGTQPGAGWELDQGVLHLQQGTQRGGNLLSRDEFGDFELVFEWKIAARGNNGVKYRVRDYHGKTLGIEYQLIDDVDYGGLRPEQTTASIYDLFAPASDKPLRPIGEFNRSAIVVRHQHLEHFLNGRLVAEQQIGDPTWRQHVADSKFADAGDFGENVIGRIMLTDHNSEVWFRNMFVRRLDAVDGVSANGSSYFACARSSSDCSAPSSHIRHSHVRRPWRANVRLLNTELRLVRCCH